MRAENARRDYIQTRFRIYIMQTIDVIATADSLFNCRCKRVCTDETSPKTSERSSKRTERVRIKKNA